MNKNFWHNKNIFVTGASGFLGSWLIKELLSFGARITVIIRDYEAHSNFYQFGFDKKVNIVNGDLINFLLLSRIFNEYEIDTCFHLAAQPLVPTANRSPLSTFESNIRGTWNVLEAARKNPLKPKVVIASSDKAYGSSNNLPYTENQLLKGDYPYDVSKSCTDILAQSYYKTYKLPVTISRCGNFYGGGDTNWSRIVPGTFKSIIFNENPIIRSDGKLIRDYFFVKDVVSAYLALGEGMDDESIHGEAFNFGTETPISVIDLVNNMINISGKKNLKPEILGKNHGEILEQYLSSKKAYRVLGWSPKYSLEHGLIQSFEWYKDFFNKI